MEKNKMVLNIAGQEFRITAGSEEEVRALEEDVNNRIRKMQARYPWQSTSRCTLLAMLEMADELRSHNAAHADVDKKIAELTRLRTGEEKTVTPPVKRPFERKKPVGV